MISKADDGEPDVVAWLTAWRRAERDSTVYRLTQHRCHEEPEEAVGNPEHLEALEEDEDYAEGKDVATAATPEKLLQAAAAFGAVDDRWVNFGMIADEYHDLRKAKGL